MKLKPKRQNQKSIITLTSLILILILGPLIYFSLKTPTQAAAWLSDAWFYRTAYTINNTGSTINAERKIKLDIDTATLISAGKLQSDCDDARFTDSTGQLLDYFIDTTTGACNTASTDFYLRVPSVPAGSNTYYFYYGNPSATQGRQPDYFADSTLGQGLRAYWNLNQTTANTCTGGTNDACDSALTYDAAWINNATYTASGKRSGALTLDGTDDYAQITGLLGSPSTITISAWAKFSTVDSAGAEIVSIGDYVLLRVFPDGSISGHYYNGSTWNTINNATNYRDNNWHHFVYVVNPASSSQLLYADNTQVASATQSTAITYTGQGSNTFIGRHGNGGSSNDFNGTLDDIRVYSRALTAPEISTIYNSGTGSEINVPLTYTPASTTPATEEKGPAPILSLSFDEGTGTTTYDASSNANHGTLTNGPQWRNESECISGKCLYFDGSDDYVDIGSDIFQSSSGTVSTWIKTNDLNTASQTILTAKEGTDQNSYFTFRIEDGNAGQPYDAKLKVIVWPTTTAEINAYGNTTLQSNKWYFISATMDTSEGLQLYINGKKETLTYLTGSQSKKDWWDDFPTSGLDWKIGRAWYDNAWYHPFHGFIDEVSIYPYARTPAQIRADYNARGSSTGTSATFNNQTSTINNLSNGLVAYYPMDETTANTCTGGTNDTCDKSGNGNDGAWNGDATSGVGKYGNGTSFDGTGDYVDLGNNAVLNPINGLTVTGWIKSGMTSGCTQKRIVGNEGANKGYVLTVEGNCRIGFRVGGDGTTTLVDSNINATGNWQYVTGTWDNDTQKASIYIDGVQQSTITKNKDISTSHLYLGKHTCCTNSTYDFSGSLDEVRIYNRALTPAEVSALYTYAPGPIAHYKLDDNSGTSALDTSGNSYTGTLINTPQWTPGKYGSALQFDGATNYLRTPNTTSYNTMTVTAWVKANTRAQWGTIVKNWPNDSTIYKFHLGLQDTDGDLSLYIAESDDNTIGPIRETTQFPLNSWQFVAFTADGSNVRLFRNATQVGTTTAYDGTLNPGGAYTGIGVKLNNSGTPDTAPGYWDGLIDDVRIYPYARTQSQLLADMHADPPGSVGLHPVLALDFDEGTGTTTYDTSGYGNNGTLTNMASPGTTASGWTNSGKFGKALNFDGSDDFVTLGDQSIHDFNETQSFTVSIWFKTANHTGSNLGIIKKKQTVNNSSTGWAIFQKGNTNTIHFNIGSNGTPSLTESNKALNDNTWHHITAIINRETSRQELYIDGKFNQVADITSQGSFVNSESLLIGSGASYNGSLDRVRIYPYALTPDQILLDYNAGASTVLGSRGTTANTSPTPTISPSNAATSTYCPPGDTTTCSQPIAEYKLDSGTGTTALDTSGNAYTGTLTNSPTWTQGRFGQAVSFDGSDDYISISSGFTKPTTLTISTWFRTTDTNGAIFGQTSSLPTAAAASYVPALFITDTGHLRGELWTGTIAAVTSTSPVNDGQWHYAALIGNTTTQSMYLDGQLLGTRSGTIDHSWWNYSQLGTGYDGGNRGGTGTAWKYLDADIDQTRIYNYVRTPAQIAYEYNRGAPIAHYQFDECQGTTIFNNARTANNTPLGNHGTLTIGPSGTNTTPGTCTGTSGQAWYTGNSGKINHAMSFDGTDDMVSLNQAIVTQAPLSVCAWVKPNTNTSDITVVSISDTASDSYSFELTLSGSTAGDPAIWFARQNSSAVAITTKGFTVGQWHHVCGVESASNSRAVYIDGGNSGFNSNNRTPESLDTTAIGVRKRTTQSQYFPGLIDDVRIYNYALTPLQVKDVYNNGSVNF